MHKIHEKPKKRSKIKSKHEQMRKKVFFLSNCTIEIFDHSKAGSMFNIHTQTLMKIKKKRKKIQKSER